MKISGDRSIFSASLLQQLLCSPRSHNFSNLEQRIQVSIQFEKLSIIYAAPIPSIINYFSWIIRYEIRKFLDSILLYYCQNFSMARVSDTSLSSSPLICFLQGSSKFIFTQYLTSTYNNLPSACIDLLFTRDLIFETPSLFSLLAL